jgi:hypothetical protein
MIDITLHTCYINKRPFKRITQLKKVVDNMFGWCYINKVAFGDD